MKLPRDLSGSDLAKARDELAIARRARPGATFGCRPIRPLCTT